MAYTRVNWENSPSTATPRNATNLNNMDAGIKENDERLNGTKPMGSIVVDDVSCKNMFSSPMETGSLDNSSGATVTDVNAIRTANFIPVNSNTDYVVSNENNYHIFIYEYDNNFNFIKYTGGTAEIYLDDVTITTSSTTKYIKIRTAGSYTENNTNSLWMLELGTEATSYTPYFNIVKEENGYVKENTTFYANDFKCKNLFNKSNVINAYLSAGDGQPVANADHRVSNYIDIDGVNYITVSGSAGSGVVSCFYNSSKTYLSSFSMASSETTKTVQVPADAKYIRITIHNSALNNYQLEVGSEATTYTPYKEFENQEIYSLGEMRIGTWINGKPLYRKVFDGTTASSGVSTSLTTNVDYVVNQGGFILIPGGYAAPLPYIDTSNNYAMIMLNRGTHELYIYHSTSYVSRNYTVWVDYTKTTD